jgi:hypothetical protein
VLQLAKDQVAQHEVPLDRGGRDHLGDQQVGGSKDHAPIHQVLLEHGARSICIARARLLQRLHEEQHLARHCAL